MIPNRFATEYPKRCLQLLEAFEPMARNRDLLGSFSVMLASSILLVPWERAKNRHPLTQEHGGGLQAGLRRLEKQRWLKADFWQSASIGEWRFSRIMGNPNNVAGWQDDQDRPSFSSEANTIGQCQVGKVFLVLRNALAHGNIVYLDQMGLETAGGRVQHIAFLSRYDGNAEQQEKDETYRLVVVRENDFLPFVQAWAHWVAGHQNKNDKDLRVA
jgi:hypothetical protein